MQVTETVSRKIVFSAADVWDIATAVLNDDFPGFTIHVGLRETRGRFAGGGIGAGIMLVVQDADGYELDYGNYALMQACSRRARQLGYPVPEDVIPTLNRQLLHTYVEQTLPRDAGLPVAELQSKTIGQTISVPAT